MLKLIEVAVPKMPSWRWQLTSALSHQWRGLHCFGLVLLYLVFVTSQQLCDVWTESRQLAWAWTTCWRWPRHAQSGPHQLSRKASVWRGPCSVGSRHAGRKIWETFSASAGKSDDSSQHICWIGLIPWLDEDSCGYTPYRIKLLPAVYGPQLTQLLELITNWCLNSSNP